MNLVHSYKAPTEAHTVGQQIDDILSDAKTRGERLKGAARKRKTVTRQKRLGAEELAAKLKAIDEKLARDLFDYARTVVNIELPQGVVEVKRERPSPPPPTCAETESRARCPASGGGGSRHRGVPTSSMRAAARRRRTNYASSCTRSSWRLPPAVGSWTMRRTRS